MMWPFSSSSPNAPIISAKRAEQARALAPHDVHDVDGDHIPYLRATATEIVMRIGTGEWTASKVLEAYIARAVLAHSKTNCLTEVFFDRAIEQARALDNEYAITGKLRGPLHGVPLSIKDQFDIEGLDTTIGFSQWSNDPATQHADIVRLLLEAGAVLYVKTNVPQTMLVFECSNPVWGRTTNPYNDAFTCGGSTGGEAALLAMDGSALGLGSDIGGSLRIPAAYCGIYSFKPGNGRVSLGGARGPVPGFEVVMPVGGPMGRSVEDLVLFSRTIFGQQGRQHNIPPLPFKDVVLPGKLKFGYYTSDGYVKASPACRRAVLETVEALRKQGHECFEISIPDAAVASRLFLNFGAADGFKTLLSHLGPDKQEEALFIATLAPRLPSFVRWLASWALETIVGDKIFATTVRAAKKSTIPEYWSNTYRRDLYVREWYEKVWDAHILDGVIAPVQALPQLPHGGCGNFSALAVATFLYNILDMPAGCLPVTRVDPIRDQITQEWEQEAGHGSKTLEQGVFYGSRKIYDPELSKGMPVNIQVVGKKWEDEKVLAMMKVVDDALGKDRGFGPGAWDKYQESSENE